MRLDLHAGRAELFSNSAVLGLQSKLSAFKSSPGGGETWLPRPGRGQRLNAAHLAP